LVLPEEFKFPYELKRHCIVFCCSSTKRTAIPTKRFYAVMLGLGLGLDLGWSLKPKILPWPWPCDYRPWPWPYDFRPWPYWSWPCIS